MLAQEEPRTIALGIASRLVRDQAAALAPQNCVIALLENIDAQLNCPIGGRADRERQHSQRNIFFVSRQKHPNVASDYEERFPQSTSRWITLSERNAK